MNESDLLLSSKKLVELTNNKYLKYLLLLYNQANDESSKNKILFEIQSYLTKTGLINILGNLVNQPAGDLDLGISISSGSQVSINSEDLEENLLIIAASGHGKTNLIAHIIKQLINKGKKLVVFDYKKNFASLFPLENTVYLSKETPLNLLQKPDFLDSEEWAQILSDSLSTSLSLLTGSRSLLISGILKVYNNSSLITPSLTDLIYTLENIINNKQMYKEYGDVVISRIMYLQQLKLFRGSHQDYNKMLNSNIVVDLSNLGNLEARVLFYFILSLLYISGIKKIGQKYTIVVDDAHSLFDINQERNPEQGIPLIHQYLAKMRELGLGLIVADQQLSALVSSIVQNSKTKLIGKIDLADDFSKINLKPEEVKGLEKGEFLLIYNNKKERILVPKEYIPAFDMEELYLTKTIDVLGLSEDNESIERMIILELKNNPFQSWNKLKRKLMLISDESHIDSAISKLINESKIGKVSVSTSMFSKSQFYFLKEDYDENTYLKMLLSKLVYYKLKKMDVTFFFDGEGFVIYRPKKMYVGIMKTGDEVSRLAESFYKVYDVVDYPLSENAVIADISDPMLIPRIIVSKIYNFDIRL